MSAIPTRVDWPGTPSDPGSPLQEGNRVLESIARQEALRALLAFSDLHEKIRKRRLASGRASDRDLFETERFILDEVLQLVCDRVYAVTRADGVVIALAEESKANASNAERSTAERSKLERPKLERPKSDCMQMVCRAAAGPLALPLGTRIAGESEFVQDGLRTGRTLRFDDGEDDCEIDTRPEFDFARQMGARSTVLIPLRGRHQMLGVLQAFSKLPRAFTDHDVRCFDLFAELVLSALRPDDQDRRIYWLSDVADDVLQPKLAAAANTAVDTALSAPQETEIRETELRETTSEEPLLPLPSFLQSPSYPGSSSGSSSGSPHPGLNVVMVLMAVAALFSAGAWWGMQIHERTAATKVATPPATRTPANAPTSAQSEKESDKASDNLMTLQFGSDTAPSTAIANGKLAARPNITGVRHWSSSAGSTVVIDMEDQVPYEVHRLVSPERIYFDLHDTVLAPDLDGKTMDVGDPSLSRVRVGQPVAGVTRIVLDTKGGSNFSVSMESNPYRLVVELRSNGNETAPSAKRSEPDKSTPSVVTSEATPKQLNSKPTEASSEQEQAPGPAKAAPVAGLAAKPSDQPSPVRPLPMKTAKLRIVLDAGHGGWDLGTVGRKGLLEKNLVLDVTERLGKLLQARLGSDVMFTRTDDTYLPLDQRADFANQAQADLFVSVHANYSTSTTARGVETYYTNLFSAPGSKEVEKHDDGTFAKPTPVSLSAGDLHEKIEESRKLAASVQRSLYAKLSANSPNIRNRGIKDSAFVVLTGTTMPAILTEISFVSSPADEHNLQSEAYRQQIAEALYQGIARYQQSAPRAKIAQLQTAAAR